MDEPSSPEGNALNLKIKFKSASLDDFVARYGADVSAGGIFIRTKQPLSVGTPLHFDFTLGDGAPLMAGLGTVVWVREADASRVGSVPGMGVRFDQLTPEGQQIHQQILVIKAKHQERSAGGAPVPTSPFPLATASGGRLITPPASAAVRPSTPIPAARPSTPVPPASARPAAAPAFNRFESDGGDDFESAGKTEIADRPPNFYFDAIGKKQSEASPAGPRPSSAPTMPLDEAETDSQHVKASGSGVPLQPVDLGNSSGGLSAPIELIDVDSKGNEVGASSASITDLPPATDAPAAFGSSKAGAASLKVGKESSWLDDALKATSDDSAVPHEAANEPTQESAVGPEATIPETPALADETAAAATSDDRNVDGDLSEIPTGGHGARSGKSGKKLVVVGSLAACVAFAGVYLWMTKPWEKPAPHVGFPPPAPSASPAAAPNPLAAQPAAPAPVPAAAEPAKAAEPVKAAEAAKAAEPVKPVPAEPEKPAAVAQAEKPREVAAEPKPEHAIEPGKRSGVSGKKSSPKSAPAPTPVPIAPTPAPAPAPSAAENPTPAPAPADLVYLLKIKSVPPGAHVIMDGEPMGTTPFQRRILDIDKPHSILVRKPGFDSYERSITKADFGPPFSNTSTLNISAKLTKLKAPPGAAAPAPEEPAAPAPEQPEKL
jgi:uncharacterized protein (TIGR02266 family)